MLTWEHTGFSAIIGECIEAADTKQRLFVARYLKKCAISNERLSVTIQGKDTVVHLATAGVPGAPAVPCTISLGADYQSFRCVLLSGARHGKGTS